MPEQNTQPAQPKMTGLELVKQEMPTIEALISLNIGPGENVRTLALQELEFLKMQAELKPVLFQCTPQSVLLAVKSVIKKNLSLDPQAGLVYIKTRSVNIAQQGQVKQWVKVLEIQETANGLISVNRQCGRILDQKRPVVKKDEKGKVKEVQFEYLVPSVPAPRWEMVAFDDSDFQRWRKASHKENRRAYDNAQPQYKSSMTVPDDELLNYANPNYTSFNGGLDPEFARAKAIRHGLKKLGTNPNEGRAKAIVVDKKDVHIVQTEAAHQETEDAGGSNGFAQYEEVFSETAPIVQQQNTPEQQNNQKQPPQQQQQPSSNDEGALPRFDPDDFGPGADDL